MKGSESQKTATTPVLWCNNGIGNQNHPCVQARILMQKGRRDEPERHIRGNFLHKWLTTCPGMNQFLINFVTESRLFMAIIEKLNPHAD
jgi:hypothetical protein